MEQCSLHIVGVQQMIVHVYVWTESCTLFFLGLHVIKWHVSGKTFHSLTIDTGMIKLLLPCTPQSHTDVLCVCAYTHTHTHLCESEGRAAVLSLTELAACHEARESVNMLWRSPSSVSSLKALGLQRKQGPMSYSSFTEMAVLSNPEKLNRKPVTGQYIKNRSVLLKVNQ